MKKTTKRCSICLVEKPLTEFYKDNNPEVKCREHQNKCKICTRGKPMKQGRTRRLKTLSRNIRKDL